MRVEGGRIAEITTFGDDFAMAFAVELVEEDTIESGDVTNFLDDGLVELGEGGGAIEFADGGAGEVGEALVIARSSNGFAIVDGF